MSDARHAALARMSIWRTSSDAILAFSPHDYSILTLNPATEELFGYHGTELFGYSIACLFAAEPAAGESAPPEPASEPPVDLFDGGPREYVGLRADGTLFPMEVVITAAELGEESFYAGIFRDISSRKRTERALRDSEARFRAAVDALNEGLIITDLDDRVMYVNARMAQMHGSPPEEMVGHPARELLIPPETWPDYEERTRQRAEGLAEQYEMQLQRADGEFFWAEINAAPFRDASGAIVGSLGAVMDVTERKRIQEELVAAVDAAEDATRAKSAFLANMSHELRTPLNAIIGYSEMLAEELEERSLDELVPDVRKIHGSGKHLLTVINDILDLSKIEAGKLDLYVETLEIEALIREAAATLEPLVEGRGNVLEVRVGPALGLMRTDITRLRQVLLNLLSNANKFTEGGRLRLEAERFVHNAAPWVRIKVRDTGIGMTPEQLGKLFRAFTQADVSTTRKYGGTGLGLVISRQLCQMMGGDITVESVAGQGSTFTVQLPTNTEDEAAAAASAGIVPGASAPLVLVVDDDRLVRDLLKRFLMKEGFRVAMAANGDEGLKAARESRPAAITLDVVMAGSDGWSVLRAIRSDSTLAATPVVMVTIVDNPTLGAELGATAYLTKPIDWRRLSETLARYK
jgi:PAS domain S-box-containing protein